jgi:hypothetical protein
MNQEFFAGFFSTCTLLVIYHIFNIVEDVLFNKHKVSKEIYDDRLVRNISGIICFTVMYTIGKFFQLYIIFWFHIFFY